MPNSSGGAVQPTYGTAEAAGPAHTHTPGETHRPHSPNHRRFTRSLLLVQRLQSGVGGGRQRGSSAEDPATAEDEHKQRELLQCCGGADSATGPQENLPEKWNDMRYDMEGLRLQASGSQRIVLSAIILLDGAAIAAIAHGAGPVIVFWLSFFGLLPVAMKLGDLTEMLAGWCGPVAGGLINATLGNATEAIVMIAALRHSLVGVEQAALLGGVLSNMLLVLGCSFLVGGVVNLRPQHFDKRTTTADVGVLFIACLGVLLPTAFASAAGHSKRAIPSKSTMLDSRCTAVVLLIMYGAYLVFTLWPVPAFVPEPQLKRTSSSQRKKEDEADAETPLLPQGSEKSASVAGSDDDDDEAPTLSAITIGILLVLITVIVAILSNSLVTAVFPVSAALGIPADFIAVVLLPVVGNVAELATAVMAAARDNLDLSIAVALGSATQIALFLVPVAVMFGWAIDVPMSLDFQPTFALAFFGAVLAVAVLVIDGESHWLKGVVLLGAYAIMVTGMAAAPGAAGVASGYLGPDAPASIMPPTPLPATAT